MIRRSERPCLATVLALAVATGMSPAGASPREPAPFQAAFAVRWGGEAGSEAFRADLARTLGGVLATRCFANVSEEGLPAAGAADVDIGVVLSEVLDETLYDDSIADALKPGDDSKPLRRSARVAVGADATLSLRESGRIVKHKRIVVTASRRPIFPGEDPQSAARAEVVERIGSDLARWLGCGRTKLEHDIREAIDATARPTPPR